MRRTKIVATVGPACSNPDMIVRLLEAGMDVARLNFSHGTHDDHARRITALREASKAHEQPLALLPPAVEYECAVHRQYVRRG